MYQGTLRKRGGRLTLGLVVTGLLVTLVDGNTAHGQSGQGKYVVQATARLSKLIDQANTNGYKLSDNNFSVGGGWLKQSQNTWVPLFTMTLEGGREYRLLAAGDDDARDVDLQIVDPNNVNNVLASDTGTSAEASVNFRPNATQKYLIRLRLYDADQNLPCLCLGIVLNK